MRVERLRLSSGFYETGYVVALRVGDRLALSCLMTTDGELQKVKFEKSMSADEVQAILDYYSDDESCEEKAAMMRFLAEKYI